MTHKICKISLFSAILATVSVLPSYARVTKNSNRSYADAYNQVNAIRYQQEYMDGTQNLAITASATNELPVAVDNQKLAESILNNESTTTSMSKLEACAMIYPNGVFKWAVPESGVRLNPTDQCVAVVNLIDANSNAVLATTTVAAGDSMKCNIDMFPQSGYNRAALSNVMLPADNAPTLDDVKAVMNQEQKQNAGLKIAAGALIAGVAGNLLAPKEAGAKTGKIPLGTGKTQLKDTAIGAVAGAGIMAASTYSGKVAGDTIKSTAVNAASGMIVGNMMAGASGGDSVLATTKCSMGDGNASEEHDCIVGKIQKTGEAFNCGDGKTCIINAGGNVKRCANEDSNYKCEDIADKLTNVIIKGSATDYSFKEVTAPGKSADNFNIVYWSKTDDDKWTSGNSKPDNAYYEIVLGDKITDTKHAYAVFPSGTLNKPTGYKENDWTQLQSGAKYYIRNINGTAGKEIDLIAEGYDFVPSKRDATSDELIDLSNQARAKATLTGTAAGGALGGFSGYQGAQSELNERWASAQIEYKDSLTNFVCMTGGRFLSQYNDYLEIPTLKESLE